MMKFLMTFMMINMMIAPLMTHPLSLSMNLFMLMMNTSIILLLFLMNSWFSYIMCLIMISGLMVLIIYMTSMASNEKFNFNMKFSLLMLIITILILNNNNYFNMTNILSLCQESLSETLNFNLIISKYLNYPSNLLMFMTMIYLFVTMISSVKITEFKKGPLRSMN
uniref:NADH deshydrogenase subunit 6 n=1 Tax=Passalidae sp. GENSP01 TaxID=1205571 RepID=A0A0S2MRT3_9SCAR|nr:NADH deshydrogenase subunit 6 [Passalidae sp. GENSP01]